MLVWILILTAVHVNNPNDRPGRIEVVMQNREQCELARQNYTYELKFKSFTVEAVCIPRQY